MKKPDLAIASEIADGIENLWISSASTLILLSIDIHEGKIRNFSCRLGPGIVLEAGEARDVSSDRVYPTLCIFAEDDYHNVSPMQFIRKCGNEWRIEAQNQSGP